MFLHSQQQGFSCLSAGVSRETETMRSLFAVWLGASLPALLWASSSASLLVEGDNDPSRICKPAPYWQVQGKAPMRELLGDVVVVALLKAS